MASEIRGTVGSLQSLPNVIYQSKVSAPKNPKLIRELKKIRKVIITSLLKPQQQQQKKKILIYFQKLSWHRPSSWGRCQWTRSKSWRAQMKCICPKSLSCSTWARRVCKRARSWWWTSPCSSRFHRKYSTKSLSPSVFTRCRSYCETMTRFVIVFFCFSHLDLGLELRLLNDWKGATTCQSNSGGYTLF